MSDYKVLEQKKEKGIIKEFVNLLLVNQNNLNDELYIVGEGIKIKTTYSEVSSSTIRGIEKYYPCKNIAETPDEHFVLDPISYVEAEEKGEIIAGVTYNPILNELFWAHKGSGSWINNQRLRVSQRDKLDGCMFTSGVQIKHEDILEKGIAQIGSLQRKTSVRILGSSALDLANVASGKFDGFWSLRLNLWDIVAGIILVNEAGGICLNEKGNVFDPLNDESLIASSAAISGELLKSL